MLVDLKEIEIIANAIQKNVRDPLRSRIHFENIFSSFLNKIFLEGTVSLDLGPGQFDFGEILKIKKGNCWGFDRDPAVVELGEYKGYKVISGDLKQIHSDMFPEKFDGLFCKFSINAFWFGHNLKDLEDHVNHLCDLLKDDGWAWIAPWNGVPKKENFSVDEITQILDVQKNAFESHGFSFQNLSIQDTKKYGVSGAVANNALFTRNLG